MQQIQKLNVKAAILDMDGVLWKRAVPLVDLPALFTKFDENNIKFMFATNNATSTTDEYVEKLSGFGVQVESWQIVTAAMATGYLMRKEFPAGWPGIYQGFTSTR